MIAANVPQRLGLGLLCLSLVTACAGGSSAPTSRVSPTGEEPSSAGAPRPSSAGAPPPSSFPARPTVGAGGPPTSGPATPGHLVAVGALTGRQLWRTQVPMSTVSAPLVAGDLLIVGGTDDCHSNRMTVAGVRALTGATAWHVSVAAVLPCDFNERVFLAGDVVVAGGSLGGSADGKPGCPPSSSAQPSGVQTAALVGLNAVTGRQLWRYAGTSLVLGATADEVFAWTGQSNCLVGLDSRTGRVRWSRTMPVVSPTLASGPAGTFLEGQRTNAPGELLRINPTSGATMWSDELPLRGYGGQLALTRELSTAVQVQAGGLPPPSPGAPSAFAVTSVPPTTTTNWVTTWDAATGRELWRVQEPDQVVTLGGPGPVLVSHFGTGQGVDALDPQTGHRLWSSAAGQVLVTDGTTVLTTSSSSVSALKVADGKVRWSIPSNAFAGSLGDNSAYLPEPGTPRNPNRGG